MVEPADRLTATALRVAHGDHPLLLAPGWAWPRPGTCPGASKCGWRSHQTDPVYRILTAAAAALDAELTDVEELSRGRSLVLRARAGDRSVILKAPLESGPGSARELAALRVLRDLPGVVPLLAEADDPPVLVLADLGTGPSVADALLGRDPAVAEAALGAWATALGTLQAATTGRRDAFAAALAELSPLGPPEPDTSAGTVASAATTLDRLLPRLGVRPAAAALDELRELRVGGPAAVTPGDACPDNNVLGEDGCVLIDFEWAEFRPVAWDAAYLRVPWPTCWCSWALPADAAERALGHWRAAVGPLPAGFDAELERATLAWAFISAGFFLPRILDSTDSVQNAAGPIRRAFVQHRLATAPGDGPLADLAAEIAAALRRTHGDHPLALAPAFR